MLLSLEDVRAAVEACEWSQADELLADYNAKLRALFEGDTPPSRVQCQALLDAQKDFMSELARARDFAGSELSRLQRDSRGVRAYLGA